MNHMPKCGGTIEHDTTDEELRARGFSDDAIKEIREFGKKLQAKYERQLAGERA